MAIKITCCVSLQFVVDPAEVTPFNDLLNPIGKVAAVFACKLDTVQYIEKLHEDLIETTRNNNF